ncbi:MAG: PIG-L family deacetylase [Patescibacteria group bacterium]|nr:PIG-L family deacetylase [Patescibacteria group bacterium]
MKILVLVAHPDDETIMCGGTIDKLVNSKHEVYVSFYTKNEQAFFGKEKQQFRVKRTTKEAELSSKVLGFKYNFLDFKDMDLVKDKGLLIRSTINEIRRVKPDVIITHNLNDKHIDHRTLAEIVPEANFQSGCRLCGGHEIWKAGIVLQGEVDLEMTSSFNFNIISSLSVKNITKKIKAFSSYESVKNEHQTTQDWLFEKIKITAKLRGMTVGNEYGEAFCLNNYSPISAASTKLLPLILE